MKITEPRWSVLETRVRTRFPLPTPLKQLEDVLQEEWNKILLETANEHLGLIKCRKFLD
jgi:hypothetical protein